MTCRTNLFKELIISTVNKIINGNNTVYVTKSPKVLEKGIDSKLRKPPQAGRAYRMCETIIECVISVKQVRVANLNSPLQV